MKYETWKTATISILSSQQLETNQILVLMTPEKIPSFLEMGFVVGSTFRDH